MRAWNEGWGEGRRPPETCAGPPQDCPQSDAAALAAHARLVQALRDPAAYAECGYAVAGVELIETHISSVLLAGAYAYKLKKPVNLGFVDFTTLERRRHFCQEELRLNRRSAPALYLDVVPIVRSSSGRAYVACAAAQARAENHGHGSAHGSAQVIAHVIDYAVRMRRFAGDARLDQITRAGQLNETLIDRLALAIATLHAHAARAPARSDFGAPATICRWTIDNLNELRALVRDAPLRRRIDALARWTEVEFERRAALFAARRNSGFVRECHGDLHLGNLVLVDDAPLPFDCVEFDPQLRFIDVMSDVAFTWMDLIDYGERRCAARLLSAYLEATGDYAGLATLRFYAVYRALVRAKVALIRSAQPDARGDAQAQSDGAAPGVRVAERYIAVAESLAQVPPPRLILTCGVSGSGKTTVAQHVLEQLGAVRVRSDVERKRLAGLAAHAHAPSAPEAGLYDATSTRNTYRALARAAAAILDAGFVAVVDATFLQRADRAVFRALATLRHAAFSIVLCEATPATLQARVAARAARGTDASDATIEVLARQLRTREPLSDEEQAYAQRLSTDTDSETLRARCAALAQQAG